jgi:hypothetical protein
VVAIITYNYEFKFVNEVNKTKKPVINQAVSAPVVMAKINKIIN